MYLLVLVGSLTSAHPYLSVLCWIPCMPPASTAPCMVVVITSPHIVRGSYREGGERGKGLCSIAIRGSPRSSCLVLSARHERYVTPPAGSHGSLDPRLGSSSCRQQSKTNKQAKTYVHGTHTHGEENDNVKDRTKKRRQYCIRST